MNEHHVEMRLFEALEDLSKSGFSVDIATVPCSAVGKSDVSFLSTVREATIRLIPPTNWGVTK